MTYNNWPDYQESVACSLRKLQDSVRGSAKGLNLRPAQFWTWATGHIARQDKTLGRRPTP
jgi:hypothetical protein